MIVRPCRWLLGGAVWLAFKLTVLGLLGEWLLQHWADVRLLLPVVPVTGAIGLALRGWRRRPGADEAPFVQVLRVRLPSEHAVILAELEARYVEVSPDIAFSSTSTNPIDRRLALAARFLSLIQVLERRGYSVAHIEELCLEVARVYVTPRHGVQRWFRRLPARLIGTRPARVLIALLGPRMRERGHPDGFVAELLTDPNETLGLGYGIDILECGICKLYAKHGASRYVSVLCRVDEITSQLAGLQLVRSGTLAGGAKKCDFRFRRRE